MTERVRAGTIATALFAVFLLAMNPPVVSLVSDTRLVSGIAPLYLWYVGWGIFGSLVLVWAAWRDAFGISAPAVRAHAEGDAATTPREEQIDGGPDTQERAG